MHGKGGMHGEGACVTGRGVVRGVCVVKGGVCGEGGCVW